MYYYDIQARISFLMTFCNIKMNEFECNSTYARVIGFLSTITTRRGTKKTCNLNERWILARRHNCSARISSHRRSQVSIKVAIMDKDEITWINII